jgi:uncharacterized LabA/DUF88 family protein
MKVAILVDGGFFVRRFGRVYPNLDAGNPAVVAKQMQKMCLYHLSRRERGSDGTLTQIQESVLHRIFFYDCPPLTKRLHQPISKKALNLAATDTALFRAGLHKEVLRLRKVALRLGHLDEKNAEWQLRSGVLKALLKGERRWQELVDGDFHYYARQKVVDMKVGIDITLLAQKGIVDRIVLVAGDSDFVPAAKHARREGIDFILDPMWNPIAPDLHEHIDGLRSTCPRPGAKADPDKEVAGYADPDDL